MMDKTKYVIIDMTIGKVWKQKTCKYCMMCWSKDSVIVVFIFLCDKATTKIVVRWNDTHQIFRFLLLILSASYIVRFSYCPVDFQSNFFASYIVHWTILEASLYNKFNRKCFDWHKSMTYNYSCVHKCCHNQLWDLRIWDLGISGSELKS